MLIRIKKALIGQEVRVFGRSEYFGDWGLLKQKPRSSSEVAIYNTSMFSLNAQDFELTIDRYKSQLIEEKFLKYFNVLFKSMDKKLI